MNKIYFIKKLNLLLHLYFIEFSEPILGKLWPDIHRVYNRKNRLFLRTKVGCRGQEYLYHKLSWESNFFPKNINQLKALYGKHLSLKKTPVGFIHLID